MRRPIKRKRWKSFLYSPLSIILLLFLVVLLGRSVWGVYGKSRISKGASQNATLELSSLESRKEAISEELENLENGSGEEAAIRERFQVAKPGENAIIIVDDKTKKTDGRD